MSTRRSWTQQKECPGNVGQGQRVLSLKYMIFCFLFIEGSEQLKVQQEDW